jgi:hypothetical protein
MFEPAPKESKTVGKSISGPKWIPPPEGLVKINVDATTSKNTAKSAFAAVPRGDDGSFLGASTVVLSGLSDAKTLEAMACREGLALAADIGL